MDNEKENMLKAIETGENVSTKRRIRQRAVRKLKTLPVLPTVLLVGAILVGASMLGYYVKISIDSEVQGLISFSEDGTIWDSAEELDIAWAMDPVFGGGSWGESFYLKTDPSSPDTFEAWFHNSVTPEQEGYNIYVTLFGETDPITSYVFDVPGDPIQFTVHVEIDPMTPAGTYTVELSIGQETYGY